MKTEQIVIERTKARGLWRDYQKHRHWSAPIDREVMAVYQAIAQGKMVIKALESIVAAGVNDEGLPKLAICRADAEWCWFAAKNDGSAVFATSEAAANNWRGERMTRQRVELPAGSFPAPVERRWRPRAMMPQIPLPLRPQRGLANYHILFEAEWQLVPPVDPMLLRRVGATDMWVVLAAWDLTEVERAALAARVRA